MVDNILITRNLVTKIKDAVIHNKLNMTVEQGEIFGIVGASGSGKTVLLRTLLGLNPYASGQIKVFDQDINQLGHRRNQMGVMFQTGALFSSLSVLHNICVPIIEQNSVPKSVAYQIGMQKLRQVGLPESAATKIPQELSGGMIKRVALARALALDASLIFLDEPTSGLDPISAQEFDAMLVDLQHNLGLTVIMITHDLASLSVCNHIGFIIDQKMISGTLDEIQALHHPWIIDYFKGKRAQAILPEQS